MKTTKALLYPTVALTVVFALAGCSGNGSNSAPSPSGAVTSESASAAPTTSSPPSTAVKQYTAEELSAVIPTVADSTGAPYTRVPNELVNQGIATVKQQMESLAVTPAECRTMAMQNSNIPDGAVLASGNSTADKSVLSVLSVQDPAVLTKYTANIDASIAKCGNFTVSAAGQEIKAAVTAVEVKTSAPVSSGSLVVQTLPTGNTTSVLAVTGIRGNVLVTAAATGVVLQASDSEDLVRIVDDYFAKLGS